MVQVWLGCGHSNISVFKNLEDVAIGIHTLNYNIRMQTTCDLELRVGRERAITIRSSDNFGEPQTWARVG